MIWSVNDGTGENPGIVKGGVEVGEKLFVAAYREPAEEVGMRREHIIFRGYGGTRSVRSLKQKGGFPKKLYIILYADYIGPWKLIVNPNEISRQAWQTDVQIEKTLTELDALRPDKGKVLREALATVLPYLRKKKKEKQ
jgi:8-oxo-dGTP pyrophosphatase MutT (NUDIX family)